MAKKEFKNKKNFDRFLCEIDGMSEADIRDIMGDEYIDTPGMYKDEKKHYDGIQDFMKSNMGEREYNKLYAWWVLNVQLNHVKELSK